MNKVVLFGLLFSLFVVGGCAKKEKTALRIGNIEISAKEFDQAFQQSDWAGRTDQEARKKFLERFVDRKLILKEAERLGLDKDPEFLQSLQLFWEQSLLKLVIAKKGKELSAAIRVADNEVSYYYNQHKAEDFPNKDLVEVYDQIKWSLIKAKESEAMEAWVYSLKDQAKVDIDYRLLGMENQ